MATVGDWLELIGTLTTVYGLWFAWNRNSNRRLRRWISRRADWLANKVRHYSARLFPCLRRDAAVTVRAAEAIATAHAATVDVRSGIDPSRPLQIQIQMMSTQLVALSRDLQAFRQRVDDSQRNVRELAQSADAAAREAAHSAVSSLRDRSRVEAFTDLSIALVGILVTAAGITVGMIADGRFSWLPL
ncbi:hypothetical protein [Nocardia tenerifensis]|nr:hypothetical protein [Nocardia tenerifensis]